MTPSMIINYYRLNIYSPQCKVQTVAPTHLPLWPVCPPPLACLTPSDLSAPHPETPNPKAHRGLGFYISFAQCDLRTSDRTKGRPRSWTRTRDERSRGRDTDHLTTTPPEVDQHVSLLDHHTYLTRPLHVLN